MISGTEREAPTEDADGESDDSDIEDWDTPEGESTSFVPASQYKPAKKKRRVRPNLPLILHILNPAPRINH